MELLCFCEQIFKLVRVANVLLYVFRFSSTLQMMVVVKMDTPTLCGNCKTDYTFLEKKVIVLLLYLQAFIENKNPWSVL